MNINFESMEKRARYIVGIGAAAALALVMAWKFTVNQVVPAFVADMPVPTLVMADGYRVQLDGQVAEVYGDDEYECDGRICKGLKVELGVSKVVTLAMAGKLQKERWSFAKVNNKLVVKRPNGGYVLPANQH
jgi:hypothetical protein